jgi:hypothetical protein
MIRYDPVIIEDVAATSAAMLDMFLPDMVRFTPKERSLSLTLHIQAAIIAYFDVLEERRRFPGPSIN